MSYTKDQMETALTLQARLVAGGVDPEYAALRVERSLHRLAEGVAALAEDIEATTPAKFKAGTAGAAAREREFYEDLRRRDSGDEPKGKGYWDKYRLTDEEKKSARGFSDPAAELAERAGRPVR